MEIILVGDAFQIMYYAESGNSGWVIRIVPEVHLFDHVHPACTVR